MSAITDAKVGPVTCATTTLAPSASTTCTKTYTLTQADVDAGHVPNSATASGTPPTGAPVTGTDATDSPIANVPGLTLAKTAGALADLDANGPDAGDTVPYSFLVTNTGNVTPHLHRRRRRQGRHGHLPGHRPRPGGDAPPARRATP